MRTIVLALVCTAALHGQSRFNWSNYCFKNESAAFCPGRDYAVRNPPPNAPARSSSPDVVRRPFHSAPETRTATPTMIVLGGIDWRFADPFADVLAGFNVSGLVNSPLVRGLLTQIGTDRGLTEEDMRKVFEGLGGVDQAAISVRDGRAVAMMTGSVTDLRLPPAVAGLKTALVSGNGMLTGHADAVDQANRRITYKSPEHDLAQLAEGFQAGSEFWAIVSARMLGPQAAFSGLKRFAVNLSVRGGLYGDVVFEFNGTPTLDTLRKWQKQLGPTATIEGSTVHLRAFADLQEAQKQLAEIRTSPIGEQLGALIEGARYLPVRDTSVPVRTKPVILGLDGGPREVGSKPKQ